MSKKVQRTIGIIMVIIMVAFVGYAMTHPESSFPWSGRVTTVIYIIYIAATVILLVAPFKKRVSAV